MKSGNDSDRMVVVAEMRVSICLPSTISVASVFSMAGRSSTYLALTLLGMLYAFRIIAHVMLSALDRLSQFLYAWSRSTSERMMLCFAPIALYATTLVIEESLHSY